MKTELESLSESMKLLEEFAGAQVDFESIKKRIMAKDEELRRAEAEERKLSFEMAKLSQKKEISEDNKSKILNLDSCPTCMQNVTLDHKKGIEAKENAVIGDINKEISRLSSEQAKRQEDVKRLKAEVKSLEAEQGKAEVIVLKKNSYAEKAAKKKDIESKIAEIKKAIGAINAKKIILEEKASGLKGIDEQYSFRKKDYDENINLLRAHESRQKESHGRLAIFEDTIRHLEAELKGKKRAKSESERILASQHWISTLFMPLMDSMEKSIMLKVHSDFDALFQKWLGMLIEQGSLSAKLDESYTPVVLQNGHDIDYAHLSGGEKTAIALAYRLSLNQVINSLMKSIKTRDMLILDEPTDGFSSEQLDRVKDVIDELKLGQIIIVSHEPKVEGFVDNVIRFRKEDHISRLV